MIVSVWVSWVLWSMRLFGVMKLWVFGMIRLQIQLLQLMILMDEILWNFSFFVSFIVFRVSFVIFFNFLIFLRSVEIIFFFSLGFFGSFFVWQFVICLFVKLYFVMVVYGNGSLGLLFIFSVFLVLESFLRVFLKYFFILERVFLVNYIFLFFVSMW